MFHQPFEIFHQNTHPTTSAIECVTSSVMMYNALDLLTSSPLNLKCTFINQAPIQYFKGGRRSQY